MRDYATGDSFGRIHWLLSAKYQRLMSKTFEQPLTTDLWILLDLDRKVADFRRVPYPVHLTQAEIRDAGLPPLLAERLERGE